MPAEFRFRPRVESLGRRGDLAGELSRLRARTAPVLLDSAAGEPSAWSVLAFDPLPAPPVPSAGIAGLRALLARLATAPGDAVPGPFQGGFLGALAYDLGAAGERPLAVAPEPWGFPNVLGGLYVDFLVRDERAGETWLVLGDEPGDGRAPVAERAARLREQLALPDLARPAGASGAPRRCVDAALHRARIERVRAHIGAGDIYQANLAHRFTCAVAGDPVDLYRALRARNPAPYMGFCAWDDGRERRGAVLSSSPELLLEYDGRTARTRPIKGTAARASDPRDDARRAAALLASAKDRAELVMIVDLERNDLGRCARPGSVRVEGLPTLQSYARVHHLMADVVCEPRADVGALELLAALFPGGSVSGCPKLRAMQIIAEQEGEGRGFFCGSLGFLGLDGRAAFNVLIRTLLWRPLASGGEVSFRVGGGITWGSDSAAEDQETLDKAAGILDALGARTA